MFTRLSICSGLRIIGRISANRIKRSSSDTSNSNEIHIETPKAVFEHQIDEKNESKVNSLILRLIPTNFPIIGPTYKLVVRDSQEEYIVNETVPMPKCLFHGNVKGNENVKVAISICDQNKIVSSFQL